MEIKCDWMSAIRLQTQSHHTAAVTVEKTVNSSVKPSELADTRLSMATCTPGITVITQHNGETKHSRFSLSLRFIFDSVLKHYQKIKSIQNYSLLWFDKNSDKFRVFTPCSTITPPKDAPRSFS